MENEDDLHDEEDEEGFYSDVEEDEGLDDFEDEEDYSDGGPFSFAEEIFGFGDRLRSTLAYLVLLAIAFVAVTIWLALGSPSLAGFEVLLVGFAIVVSFFLPVAVANGVRLIRSLGRWMDDYFDFALVVKFELLPAKGRTPLKRIMNKLAEVYPEVSQTVKKTPKAVGYEVGVRRKPKITWDLAIDVNYPKILRIPWIHRHFGTPRYLLVKIYDEEGVDEGEIPNLLEGLHRDLRWNSAEIVSVFIVSTGGFAPEAIREVDEEATPLLTKYETVLVDEGVQGYVLPLEEAP